MNPKASLRKQSRKPEKVTDKPSEIFTWDVLCLMIANNTRGTFCTVDFGAGRFNYTQCSKSRFKVGLEIFAKYHSIYPADGVEKLNGDMLKWKSLDLPKFDVAMFIDSLEHVDRKEGVKLIRELQAAGHVQKILIFSPIGVHPQSGDPWGHGNTKYQTHRSSWIPDDLEGFGFKVKRLNKKQMWAVWNREWVRG